MTPEEQAAADAAAAAGTGDDPDDAVELASLAIDDGKGGKVVPLSALIGSKKELKALKKQVSELQPLAANTERVRGELERAMPIINAVTSNPKLMAEAVRLAGGGAPSRESTVQPLDDQDAVEEAEERGWYLSDNVTPDAARGRRVLDRQARTIRQVAEEVIRPLAGATLGDRAERNLAAALRETDADGTPLATEESIREVSAQLPQHLLADPKVVDLVVNTAIGIDRRKGRTPKAPDAPVFLESPGGRRGPREPAISAEVRESLARVGLTEDEYKASATKLDNAGGRAVVLGR